MEYESRKCTNPFLWHLEISHILACKSKKKKAVPLIFVSSCHITTRGELLLGFWITVLSLQKFRFYFYYSFVSSSLISTNKVLVDMGAILVTRHENNYRCIIITTHNNHLISIIIITTSVIIITTTTINHCHHGYCQHYQSLSSSQNHAVTIWATGAV